MAHLLTHDPTTCGAGKLRTHAPNVQDCAEATLKCVSTITANATKTGGGQAVLKCVSTITANATKTGGGRATLACVSTLFAHAGQTKMAAARLVVRSRIFVGRTTVTRIIHGTGNSKPANACIKSGRNVPKTGSSANVPTLSQSSNVPKTGANANVPKINSSTTVPKVTAASKPKVLRINNGRRC